jgi:hypothetical protein
MNPITVSNVLSAEEIDLINENIRVNSENISIQEETGRNFLNLDSLPQSIVDKITSIAREKTGKNLVSTGRAYSTYSNQFGSPALHPHVDRNDTKFIFDYQLKSNTKWSIIVEDSEYNLDDNSGIAFEAKNLVHYRPRKKFIDGEFVSMIFFHFIDLDDPEGSRARTDEEVAKINQEIGPKYSAYWQE